MFDSFDFEIKAQIKKNVKKLLSTQGDAALSLPSVVHPRLTLSVRFAAYSRSPIFTGGELLRNILYRQ